MSPHTSMLGIVPSLKTPRALKVLMPKSRPTLHTLAV